MSGVSAALLVGDVYLDHRDQPLRPTDLVRGTVSEGLVVAQRRACIQQCLRQAPVLRERHRDVVARSARGECVALGLLVADRTLVVVQRLVRVACFILHVSELVVRSRAVCEGFLRQHVERLAMRLQRGIQVVQERR